MRMLSEQLAALRRALAAEQFVPRLVHWATDGELRASPLDIRSMRDWAEQIVDAPGLLSAFEAMLLTDVDAWTQFSKECDARMAHHHALLFGRLATKLERKRNFEEARRIHGWSRQAWTCVLEHPNYVSNLLASLKTRETYDVASVFGSVFSGQLGSYEQELLQSLALETCAPDDIDTERAAYMTQLMAGWAQAEFPLAQPAQGAGKVLTSVRHRCLDVLEKHLDSLDIVAARDKELIQPWKWLHEVLDIVGPSTAIDAACLTQVVDFLWLLRKLERDEAHVVLPILEATRSRITALTVDLQDDTAFGLQGRVADFLVFVGERADDTHERRAIFERGLQICPAHRNSAKLLSYEYLQDVESTLVQLSMIPKTATRLTAVTSRAKALIEKASVELDRVESAFAFNEEIPEMRNAIEEQRQRLKIEGCNGR